ncbi:phosphotransferase [Halomonas sp. YLGW01]|uniref:aminoglycoside phosphotransferase family protein n=1 Tax=Halomonas sp. YLGW01 TaxID=2773308 RepID=UPI00177B5500|nr:phosphotransferase [Halomonas sp. YLGW01]
MPPADPARLGALTAWAAEQYGLSPDTLELALAAGDASFRRYYRLTLPDGATRMLMDAPPAQEDSRPFLAIATAWQAAGLPVPRVHHADLAAGFLALDDLGDTPLQERFTSPSTTRAGYEQAIALIHELQAKAPADALPAYDAALLTRELDLFPDWCLERLLGIAPPPGWESLVAQLVDSALAQPRVTVHRDFDAMNLMVHDDALVLIDFQDAVAGPLSYDLISLTRGRYRRFDTATLRLWQDAFRQRAIADGRLDPTVDAERFHFWCNAMAAQRCLKVLGIFCRLTLRDGKAGYLARLPHFLAHLDDSLAPWAEFADIRRWLHATFTPALEKALAARGIDAPTSEVMVQETTA